MSLLSGVCPGEAQGSAAPQAQAGDGSVLGGVAAITAEQRNLFEANDVPPPTRERRQAPMGREGFLTRSNNINNVRP